MDKLSKSIAKMVKERMLNASIEGKIIGALDKFNEASRLASNGFYTQIEYIPLYDDDLDPRECTGFQYDVDFKLRLHTCFDGAYIYHIDILPHSWEGLRDLLEKVFGCSAYGDTLYVTIGGNALMVWDVTAILEDSRAYDTFED